MFFSENIITWTVFVSRINMQNEQNRIKINRHTAASASAYFDRAEGL